MRWVACFLCAVGLLAGLSATARAETVDEIVMLAKKGLGEEVLLAAVGRSEKGFDLQSEQIVKLKEAGVSDKVIVAMLLKKPAGAPAAAPAAAPPVPVAAPPAATLAGGLNLENVDDKAWGYLVDAATHVVWLGPAGAPEYRTLPPHGGVSLSVGAGSYEVRYQGEKTGTAFGVQPGEKSLVLVSRVETAEFEGLYASVFEKG